MSRTCDICGRGTIAGRSLPRKGLPKKKGGAGVHIGVKTARTFKINLHKKSIIKDGIKQKKRICNRCLRTMTKFVK